MQKLKHAVYVMALMTVVTAVMAATIYGSIAVTPYLSTVIE